ncbi:MAG: hypothetical protein ACREQH_01105 [Candidatus Binatus sp.]
MISRFHKSGRAAARAIAIFGAALMLDFLRGKVPKNWNRLRDSVTDNFRGISPRDFRVLT